MSAERIWRDRPGAVPRRPDRRGPRGVPRRRRLGARAAVRRAARRLGARPDRARGDGVQLVDGWAQPCAGRGHPRGRPDGRPAGVRRAGGARDRRRASRRDAIVTRPSRELHAEHTRCNPAEPSFGRVPERSKWTAVAWAAVAATLVFAAVRMLGGGGAAPPPVRVEKEATGRAATARARPRAGSTSTLPGPCGGRGCTGCPRAPAWRPRSRWRAGRPGAPRWRR